MDDEVHKDAGSGAGAGAPVQVPSLAGAGPAPVHAVPDGVLHDPVDGLATPDHQCVPKKRGPPRTPGGRGWRKPKELTPEQGEAVLRMVAQGMAEEQVVALLGVPAHRIKRLLSKRSGVERLAQLRAEFVLREIEHHHDLWELLPKARKSLRTGLDAGTVKNQTDIARWLHEALVAKPAERQEIEVRGRLEHDLSPVLETIGKHLAAIREANGPRGVLDRVKPGDEVVVRAHLETGSTSRSVPSGSTSQSGLAVLGDGSAGSE